MSLSGSESSFDSLPLPMPPAVPPAEGTAPPRPRHPDLLSRRSLQWVLSSLVGLLVLAVLILCLGVWIRGKPPAATMVPRAGLQVKPAGPRGIGDDLKVKPSEPPPSAAAVSEKTILREKLELPRAELKALPEKLVPNPTFPSPVYGDLSHLQPGTMFANRDPRLRSDMVIREG